MEHKRTEESKFRELVCLFFIWKDNSWGRKYKLSAMNSFEKLQNPGIITCLPEKIIAKLVN